MAEFLAYRNGNKTDEHGVYRLLSKALRGQVVEGLTVVQAVTPNMTVVVNAGDCMIPDTNYKYSGWVDAGKSLNINTADPTNPRIDVVVVYVDKALVDATNSNSPNGIKIAVVAGTPAASPTAPSSGTIQTAIGASNPYITIAQVRVNAAVTSITNTNITDTRELLQLNAGVGINTLGGWEIARGKLVYSTYSSITRIAEFTTESDATQYFYAGMRIRFTQPTDGVKVGIIHKVESTRLHVFMIQGQDVDNESVSSVYISRIKAPHGFDTSPDKWQLSWTATTQVNLGAIASSATVTNVTGANIPIGPGAWIADFSAYGQITHAGSSYLTQKLGMSTTNNSFTDRELVGSGPNSNLSMSQVDGQISRRKEVFHTSGVTYYLNSQGSQNNTTQYVNGVEAKVKMSLTSAYL